MALHEKMAISDLQRYPWKLIWSKMWNIPSFFWLKKCEFLHAQVTFAEKPQMKINSWKKQKHWYLIQIWLAKAFKGIVVNRTMPSLHWRPLKKYCYSSFKQKAKITKLNQKAFFDLSKFLRHSQLSIFYWSLVFRHNY